LPLCMLPILTFLSETVFGTILAADDSSILE
jgi:hypothetical protein